MQDWTTAGLGESRMAMLRYAEKLTREPWSVRESDILALREVGFDDPDILHINQIVGYFNFVNRLADGLGVQLEESPTSHTDLPGPKDRDEV